MECFKFSNRVKTNRFLWTLHNSSFFCFSTKYFITPINRVHIARWVINRWSPLGKCGVRYYTESLTYYHFHTFDWRVSSWIIQKKKTRFLRRFAKTPFISPKCITHWLHFNNIVRSFNANVFTVREFC